MDTFQFVKTLDQLLNPQLFRDYCPNGLQVEGRKTIEKIVTGVTASQALIDQAIDVNADAILVHHGYFWKGEDQRVIGLKANRLKALLKSDINLIAYHLPLDAHHELGNNYLLGKELQQALLKADFASASETIQVVEQGRLIGLKPKNTNLLFSLDVDIDDFKQLTSILEKVIGPLRDVINPPTKPVRKIAWCTGAAQDMLSNAIAVGADVFISGEISERTFHEAVELGACYIAAGHHATERFGVRSLGRWIEENLSVKNQFIDVPNPV